MVGAEVVVERGHVEVRERAGEGQAVDVAGLEAGVGDGPLRCLGPDGACGSS